MSLLSLKRTFQATALVSTNADGAHWNSTDSILTVGIDGDSALLERLAVGNVVYVDSEHGVVESIDTASAGLFGLVLDNDIGTLDGEKTIVFGVQDSAGTTLGSRWARSGILPANGNYSGTLKPFFSGPDDRWTIYDAAPEDMVSNNTSGEIDGITRIPPEDYVQGYVFRAFVGNAEKDRIYVPWGDAEATRLIRFDDSGENIYCRIDVRNGKIAIKAGSTTLPSNSLVEVWSHVAKGATGESGVGLGEGQVTGNNIAENVISARHIATDIADAIPKGNIEKKHLGANSVTDASVLNISAPKIVGGLLDPKVLPSFSVSKLTGTIADANIPASIARNSEIPDVSDFLTQTQIDARVTAGVSSWAEEGDSSVIPDEKIPSSIARDSELPDVSSFIDSGDVKVFARTGDRSIESGDITSLVASKLTGTIDEARIPASIARDSDFLTQTQIDARVAFGVQDWAETGNSSIIPDEKLSSSIARTSAIPSVLSFIESSDVKVFARTGGRDIVSDDITSLDASKLTGTIDDVRIPSSIARDSEILTTFAELSGEVQTSDIADSSVTDVKIDSLDASKLTGTIDDVRIPLSVARASAISVFLTQTQIDARVAAGVLDWAETSNDSIIPVGKISPLIARTSDLPAANRLIPSGGTDGQVLAKTSSSDYAAAWEDASAGISAISTDSTINGDGTAGSLLGLADNAVSTVKIVDASVTEPKLLVSNVPADGQFLTYDLTNGLTWADVSTTANVYRRVATIYSDTADQNTTGSPQAEDTWRTVTLNSVPDRSSDMQVLLITSNGIMNAEPFAAADWLDLAVQDSSTQVFTANAVIQLRINRNTDRIEKFSHESLYVARTATNHILIGVPHWTGDTEAFTDYRLVVRELAYSETTSALADGSVTDAKIVSMDAAKLTGTIPASTLPTDATEGLNESEVDARVMAGVENWAETNNADPIPLAKLPSSTGLSQTEVDARITTGVADWAETTNTDIVPTAKLAPDGDPGNILTRTATGHEWIPTTSTQSQAVAYAGDDFVTVTLWRQQDTKPSDPGTRWRWENGWSNGAPDASLAAGFWDFSKSFATQRNPSTTDTVWIAVGSTRRNYTSDGTTYTDYDWNVYAEFDVEFSADGGTTIQSITEADSDTTHMRLRDSAGNWTPWWPIANDLNVWQNITGDMFTYSGGSQTSTSHTVNGEFEDFEAIRIEITGFASWADGGGQGISVRAPTQHIILWRTSDGWTIPASTDAVNTVRGTWHVTYDVTGTGVGRARQLEDNASLVLNWPPSEQSTASASTRTSFKLNFQETPNRLVIFGHSANWKLLRMRVHGFRRR